MVLWRFEALFTGRRFLRPAWVEVDESGLIRSLTEQDPRLDPATGAQGGSVAGSPSALPGGPVQSGAPRTAVLQEREGARAVCEEVKGWALPGLPNGHSHAFQYAMAGLAERGRSGAGCEDFWAWREAMYELALRIGPEQLEAVASMLYAEMLRLGYTAVAEFHYLHNQPDGAPYARGGELCERLCAAADRSGIALTLIPVYYRRGDFGTPAGPRQRRFVFKDGEAYGRLLEDARRALAGVQDGRLGVGVHSLRAADPAEILALVAARPLGAVFHLHVAEQRKEVEGCLRHLGARPVEWILDQLPVDATFQLVHATHMTDLEVARLAASGAGVVLCPSTEGNLGDGFFPLPAFLAAGGRWAIGSDSQVGLNPFEELRWLDYGARLASGARSVFGRAGRVGSAEGAEGAGGASGSGEVWGLDSGQAALVGAYAGGRQALGLEPGEALAPGRPLDALVVGSDVPGPLSLRPLQDRLSTLVYASDPGVLLGTVRRGRWVVKEGRHREGRAIRESFARALRALYA